MLLTRLFDLLAWLLPKAERFPRPFRQTVTQRLVDAALDCQEAVYAAQSARGRDVPAPSIAPGLVRLAVAGRKS